MVTRYVGKQPYFRGKTLYELCCNLKCFGEGRVVYRHKYADYPEKSFYLLKKVEPDMADQTRQSGTAWGEKIYRGRNYGIRQIDAGHKPDWILVPKEDEAEFCRITAVLPEKPKPPPHFDCPPLLELLTRIDLKSHGETPSSQFFQLTLKPRKPRKQPLPNTNA